MVYKGKILVVDDEVSMRELFESFFTEAGYEVLPAEGGKEALVLLQIHDVDVIFLDLKLFGMNGIELCRQIRKTKPVSMIYAMTGWSALFEIDECREAGFDDYFEKPLDMDKLLVVVEQAFERLERWKNRYKTLK
ncbi:MAG: Sporulation initiation phosphotransferase F [Smithella sp. PtaU1.Bin162]|jgi:DNA-binding response OmpR family regulator|nr:MAG: Sporulation initiation phosphotransferase F [Smithella sp. PtaU1.Bin162]